MNHELQKRADQSSKGFEKIAAELDLLSAKITSLEQEVSRCNKEEPDLVLGFEEMVVQHYNDVASARLKRIAKEIKQLREARVKALEELTRLRARHSELRTKCEVISYRQGELLWDSRLEAVKKRKWQPAA
jgi:prefoldin subunit 5